MQKCSHLCIYFVDPSKMDQSGKELRETTKRWKALHLSIDGEGSDWVTQPKGAIKKANLTFTAKFLWLIVRHCLSPTFVDNMVTGIVKY